MNINETSQLTGEGAKTTVPAMAGSQPKQLKVLLDTVPVTLQALRVDLARARDQHRPGYYQEAQQTGERLKDIFQQIIEGKLALESAEPGQFFLLYATVLSILGRIYHSAGEVEKAEEAFNQAVKQFERWVSEGTTAECYGDYGVALHMLGRHKDAVTALQTAVSLGNCTRETYCYLGMGLQRQGDIDEAKKYLIKTIELVPDPFAQKTLGEILEVQEQKDEASRVYKDAAVTMARSGDLNEALAVAGRALILKPDDSTALSIKGQVLRRLGRDEEALQALNRALELAPDNATLLGTKGQVLRRLGRDEEAVGTLQQAVKLDSGLAWAYAELGEALRRLGRDEEALQALNRALELAPDNAWALVGKAAALRRLGRDEEALQALNRALELAPDNAWALSTKGQILRRLGRDEEAVGALQQAVKLDSGLAWAYAELGEALCTLRRDEEALRALNRALELAPDNAWALSTKGQILRRLGRDEEAVGALQQAVKLDSGLAWAYAELGEALRRLGRDEEAVGALQQAVKLDSGLAWAYAELGEALHTLGRDEEALQALTRALELAPDNATFLGTKGQVLLCLGRGEEALQALDRALTLRPDNAWLLGTKGQVLRRLGRDEEAVGALQQAVKLDSGLAWAYAELGEALRTLGRGEEALQALDRALTLRPDNAWVLASKGAALGDLHHYEQAHKALDRALELKRDYPFALGIKGKLLCDVGEFQEAARILERLEHVESSAWTLRLKGWALQKLDRAEEAQKAYETALKTDPRDLWARKGIADTLYTQRKLQEAAAAYCLVIKQVKESGEQRDADTLSLLGWCHYRLEQYDDAVKVLVDALRLDPKEIPTQFNLALTLMCSGRFSLALREYKQALEVTKHTSVHRLRGLLDVARRDLEEALIAHHELKEVPEFTNARELMITGIQKADRQANILKKVSSLLTMGESGRHNARELIKTEGRRLVEEGMIEKGVDLYCYFAESLLSINDIGLAHACVSDASNWCQEAGKTEKLAKINYEFAEKVFDMGDHGRAGDLYYCSAMAYIEKGGIDKALEILLKAYERRFKGKPEEFWTSRLDKHISILKSNKNSIDKLDELKSDFERERRDSWVSSCQKGRDKL